jgi:Fe2+ or Zn2+ uptake regulation protein
MDKIKALLKTHNLRTTAPREKVLSLFLASHGPHSADDLIKALPKNFCDQATIFRILKQFQEAKLISPVNFDEGFARYEYNDPQHHHHHVVCKSCGKVEKIDSCSIKPMLDEGEKMGFKITSHRFELFGICPACR